MNVHPHPIPEHYGIEPGQTFESRMGARYRVYAITSDGYVWCLNAQDQTERIWIDVLLGWGRAS